MIDNTMYIASDGRVRIRWWNEILVKGRTKIIMWDEALDQRDKEIKKFLAHKEDPDKYLWKPEPSKHNKTTREKFNARRRAELDPHPRIS